MEQTMNAVIDGDTIVAVSTPPGIGGIAVIRLSGKDAIKILSKCWKGASLDEMVTHTAHLGKILFEDGKALDEVVVTYFKGPRSYTGEDVVEISCHGSRWIQREMVNLLVRHGARPADPGEFTKRAFLNGRLDLAQAEGVIDLISSSSWASHRMAMQQANGRFTAYLNQLRDSLIEFASLLELELDFSEEEVEFADRERLRDLADEIIRVLDRLAASYSTGKALKDGVPVVIAGAPNAGKSTLLNQLLDEEKAIVSDIPGTTRDIIEDTCEINGILFRFADTAGLRNTLDSVERIGISRAEERLSKASIVLWLLDMTGDVNAALEEIEGRVGALPEASHVLLCNKTDLMEKTLSDKPCHSQGDAIDGKMSASKDLEAPGQHEEILPEDDLPGNINSLNNNLRDKIKNKFSFVLQISASQGEGIDELRATMCSLACREYNPETDMILTNGRHYAALLRGSEALKRARVALDTGLSADFIAQDVRESLHHLGTLTGTISTPDLLASIFTRFCIGK